MSARRLNPPDLFDSTRYGFSQAVATTGGTTVHMSGQVAWDAAERVTGAGLAEQTARALENVERLVRTAGGTREHVVALRIYVVQALIPPAEGVAEALRAFFGPGHLPAATWIGVPALARPEFLVVIEATAVLPAAP